jgi:outer membrane protein TolC
MDEASGCRSAALKVFRSSGLLLGVLALLQSTSVAQQPSPSTLTLRQAVAVALERNPLRKAALADTRVALAGVGEARAGLLPRIGFSETATVGNDPVYVFGSRLRQQRFTTNDFALDRLNTPSPFGNFSTRLGGTWNLFDSFASWKAVHRAQRMQEAVNHQLERSDQEVVFRVVDAYYALLLARKQKDVAEQSLTTARSLLEHSRARFESGLSVEADLLSAQVRLASRQQELIRATSGVALGAAQLDVAMGISLESASEPAELLAEPNLPTPSLAEMEKQAIEKRPDLKRVRSEEAAQAQSVSIAKSSFGPRVNAFASWQADNPTLVAGGGGSNWMSGIEVQLDLFQGGAKRAQLARDRALQDKIAGLEQAASDGVRLEVRRAFYDLDSARQEVELTRAAVAQAQESLRINQNRYEAGLATVTDLLAAEEAARRSQTDYWQAVYRMHTSYASLELASGTLNSQSPVVTQ